MQSVQSTTGSTTGSGSLAEYLQGWLKNRTDRGLIRPNTASGYASKINRACDAIGHVKLTQVSADHIEAWLHELRKDGLAQSTISQSRAILHKALKDAVRRRFHCLQSG